MTSPCVASCCVAWAWARAWAPQSYFVVTLELLVLVLTAVVRFVIL